MALQTGRTLPSLDSALSFIEKSALSIRDRCAGLSAKAAASAVSWEEIKNVHQDVFIKMQRIESVVAAVGAADLDAKATSQYPSISGYSASVEYTALQSVVYAALDFIEVNLPTPQGAFSGRAFQFSTYNPSQTSGLRTHLNNIVAAISG